ncbi:hypothetical protein L0337_28730 [candidate division KSB1 bacterium]|nr:hypothetical protein [candidate division KSB1 bacterium]
MKKIMILGILFLSGCSSSRMPLIQPSTFHEVAVVSFDIETDPIESVKYEGKAGPVADIIEAVQMAKEFKETIKQAQNPERSEWKAQMDSIYAMLEKGLKNDLGIPLLPVDHLKGEVEYDPFGYPHGSTKKVLQSGKYPAALEITARLAFTKIDTSSIDLVFWGKTHNVQLPKLTLQVKMVDRSGKVVWQDKAEVTSNIPVVIDEKWAFGIKYKSEKFGPEIVDLFRQTVQALVRKTLWSQSGFSQEISLSAESNEWTFLEKLPHNLKGGCHDNLQEKFPAVFPAVTG